MEQEIITAASGQVQSANKAAEKAAEAIPFIIKTAVVIGAGAFLWWQVKHRFVKFSEVSSYPPANVTPDGAESRATAIYNALSWSLLGDFDTVYGNLQNLNYNGFVRVYNAFGNRAGNWFTGEKNMIEFLTDKLSAYQLSQLRFLTNGAFF